MSLLSYQIDNVANIVSIIRTNNTALDASDTGTGKTYTAVAACKQLMLHPLVICPRGVMATWKRVCKIFEVDPFFIVNYETIKSSKFYNKKGRRVKCKYIDFNEESKMYTWKHLKNRAIIFIFDEVHKCTNIDTHNGLLLISAKETEKPVLIMSATVADNPYKFRMFAYILNFLDRNMVKNLNLDFKKQMNVIDTWLSRDDATMRIYNMLYPNRGTRMRIASIPDFPETQIIAQPYSVEKKKQIEIENEYMKIAKLLEELKDKKIKDKSNVLVDILRAHQRIELIKVPLFVTLTGDFLEEKKSVVIFVNYTDTLKILADILKTNCVIWGGQTDRERQDCINNFQENINKVIICNIKCGVGISLHDLTGKHPRVSLLSPCWSSLDLIQALGRIHRAGAKSKSLQRIVYIASTVEELIAEKLEQKLKDLNSINNGDLDLSSIVFEKRYGYL
jgi:superfamily II DNA or RNA helicase